MIMFIDVGYSTSKTKAPENKTVLVHSTMKAVNKTPFSMLNGHTDVNLDVSGKGQKIIRRSRLMAKSFSNRKARRRPQHY